MTTLIGENDIVMWCHYLMS